MEVDDSGWPLVKVRWLGAPQDTEIKSFLSRMDLWLARGQRFGLLVDSRGGQGLSPEQRRAIMDHMKAHSDSSSKYLVQAVVMDNLVQRTLYYAIHLVSPFPFTTRGFAAEDEAWSWLKAELGRPGKEGV